MTKYFWQKKAILESDSFYDNPKIKQQILISNFKSEYHYDLLNDFSPDNPILFPAELKDIYSKIILEVVSILPYLNIIILHFKSNFLLYKINNYPNWRILFKTITPWPNMCNLYSKFYFEPKIMVLLQVKVFRVEAIML